MQDAIIKLKALGQMPDSIEDNPAGDIIEMYDTLLSDVKPPITKEEVEVLITIFPKSGIYGVEWALLGLVESYFVEMLSSTEYREIIAGCPSKEWRETLQVRLDNWEKKRGKQ